MLIGEVSSFRGSVTATIFLAFSISSVPSRAPPPCSASSLLGLLLLLQLSQLEVLQPLLAEEHSEVAAPGLLLAALALVHLPPIIPLLLLP